MAAQLNGWAGLTWRRGAGNALRTSWRPHARPCRSFRV